MARLVSRGIDNCRKNFAIWYLLYFGKLILAAAFSIPLLTIINMTVENSRYAGALLGGWSLDVIGELGRARENVFTSFLIVLMFYSVIVFLFKQFLNGGIYSSLLARRKLDRRDFFGQSAGLFVGNLKVSALMALVYVLLLMVALTAGSFVPEKPFQGFGAVALYPMFLRIALLYPFLIAGTILSDVLRFRLAAHPAEAFRLTLRAAVDTYRSRFVQLNGIYYVYFLPLVAVWLLAEWLAVQVTSGMGNMLGVLLELILFQVCAFLRTGQSVLGSATIACVVRADQDGFTPGQGEVTSSD